MAQAETTPYDTGDGAPQSALPEPPARRASGGDAHRASSEPDGFWTALAALLRWRWFIAGVTLLVGGAAVAVTLQMPNRYAAAARVLPPEASVANPLASALLRNAGSAASALLGGSGGDYARYLSILSSRRVLEDVVDTFDLVRVYRLADKPNPREEALRRLRANVDFPVDQDYDFLSVVAADEDPQRAADMANFMVRRLNEINTELSAQNASTYRRFVEGRHREAQLALDSVLTAAQAFQRRYGILDLDVQTQAYFTQMAELRGRAIASEIQFESLRTQLGPENEEVRMLQQAAATANARIAEMQQGGEAILPIARSERPGVVRQYVDLQREVAVQRQILEVVQPLVEQARFEEEKRVEAVQVVDPAVPPARKVAPRRSLLVLAATLGGLLLSVLFVLAYTTWRRNAAYVAERLRGSAARAAGA